MLCWEVPPPRRPRRCAILNIDTSTSPSWSSKSSHEIEGFIKLLWSGVFQSSSSFLQSDCVHCSCVLIFMSGYAQVVNTSAETSARQSLASIFDQRPVCPCSYDETRRSKRLQCQISRGYSTDHQRGTQKHLQGSWGAVRCARILRKKSRASCVFDWRHHVGKGRRLDDWTECVYLWQPCRP